MSLLFHATRQLRLTKGCCRKTINGIGHRMAQSYSQLSEKQENQFVTVYRLPNIVLARVVCKLKLYQTGLVTSLTGLSLMSETELTTPIAFCFTSLIMLGIMSEYLRKLVGMVSMNPRSGEVKIAHLNFWGNRVDRTCSYRDVIPLSDSRDSSSDVYVKLKFYDGNMSPLYMSLRFGSIVNKDLFFSVFGEVE